MKKDVDGTINNIKGVGDYLGKFATDGKVREQAMKSMGQAWDNMVEGFKKDPAYSLGGTTFEVASWFVGAGEVKAGVSAAKTTQGIVRGINAFGKTVGKAAVKNASAMAKNIAHLATRGPGLSKSIGKAAMVKMKQFDQGVSRALDNLSGKFDEAYAFADGALSKDFGKHNARVYQSSGGDWDRVVRETFGEYEDPFRKQILNNIEESKRAREASNFSDYLKKEKEVLEKVEFGEGNRGFTGKLRGETITLDNIDMKNINYVKRDRSELKALRTEFNKTVRKDFLKSLSEDVELLRDCGFDAKDIQKIKDGRVPKGYQVHHELPLDDSGTNEFDNLVLIKNEPYHKVITNYQNKISRTMNIGESKRVLWPIIGKDIYN